MPNPETNGIHTKMSQPLLSPDDRGEPSVAAPHPVTDGSPDLDLGRLEQQTRPNRVRSDINTDRILNQILDESRLQTDLLFRILETQMQARASASASASGSIVLNQSPPTAADHLPAGVQRGASSGDTALPGPTPPLTTSGLGAGDGPGSASSTLASSADKRKKGR